MFLEGRHRDLTSTLRRQMEDASENMRFEEAANLRDLISTVEEMEQKQKMAAAEGDDADIFAFYAEPPLVAVNLFHMRNGHIVDRREFFWEDQLEWDAAEFFEALLKQVYLNQPYIPGLDPCAGRLRRHGRSGGLSVRKAGPARWKSTLRREGRRKRCLRWRRRTRSTASTPVSV